MTDTPILTILIIALTAIVSFAAFQNQKLIDDLIFYPPAVSKRKQWYRFITCGFIHADMGHLLFNMFSFYLFGKIVQQAFVQLFGDKGNILYLFVYISALVVCLLPTYFKNKDNYYYKSLGASGAVSAIIFIGIFIYPEDKIGLFFIPPIIPGFVFGPLYLIGTAMMDRRGGSNINHSAHLWGALYGIAIFIVFCFLLTGFNPFTNFIDRITDYVKTF